MGEVKLIGVVVVVVVRLVGDAVNRARSGWEGLAMMLPRRVGEEGMFQPGARK